MIREFARRHPWIWALAGAVLVWLVTVMASSGRGAGATLIVALQFGAFYAMVGTGQMFVITAGPGNIDLAIPSVMTLAGYLAMGVMHGDDSLLLAGIATGLGIGLGAGLFNVLLIQGLRIPPMIATLAAGFIEQSMATAYSSGSTARPGPGLMAFVSSRVLGVPTLAILVGIIAIVAALALEHTVFGRSVLAVGQSRRAAVLARLSVRWTEASVYVLSGLLAGAAGVLLATYSGGASLDMAGDYLLMSIAVVILGGTSIAGGEATVLGVWAASLFLYLMVTMLNVLQVGAGLRFVLSGLIIIGVLSLASRGERGR